MPAHLTITCLPNSKSCIKSNSQPLFVFDNIYPGFVSPQQPVSVVNLDPKSACSVFLSASADSVNSSLMDHIILYVTSGAQQTSSTPLNQALLLGTLGPNSSTDYQFSVSLSPALDNALQGAVIKPDFHFDFVCQPVASPPGQVLGESTSRPQIDIVWLLLLLVILLAWYLKKVTTIFKS